MADEPIEHRDDHITIRVGKDFKKKAARAAAPYGGLSAAIRTFLENLIKGERTFSPDEVGRQNTQAPKRKGGKAKSNSSK